MTAEPVRASGDWLALREPADAAARSSELVDQLASDLPAGALVVHDLGSGTGSMARWLAPRLPGPQRWVLHDRDAELLGRTAGAGPPSSRDGGEVAVETRLGDVTRLDPAALAGADLITGSALLDMMTADELVRLVELCTVVGCPVLITLSVVGRVELTPADPLDADVGDAFNAHQRRDLGAGRLLGPDAVRAAAQAFTAGGRDVVLRPSPWRLGPEVSALAVEWFTGWLAAALEQRPELESTARPYARRRLADASAGSLKVTVHHEDLLVRGCSYVRRWKRRSPLGSRLVS